MTQVKTGAELLPNCIGLTSNQLASVIDANTAIAVAEYKSDAKHVRQANENYRNENTLLMQELELCKVQCLMLRGALERLNTEAVYQATRGGWDDRHELQVASTTLSATKESIEAYRNEIVQKAKSEQRESDELIATKQGAFDIAAFIRNNKGE